MEIARIKSNVQKMLAQNAPETDIDAYLASEKVTPDQLRASKDSYTIPAAPPGEIVHGADGTSKVTGSGISAQRTGDPQADAVAMEALRQREGGRTLGTSGRVAAPVLQGLSLGFGDEAVSAGAAGARAIKGGNFGNEFAIAQEIQKQELERQRQEAPVASAVGEIGGGVSSGVGLYGAGLTAARAVPAALQGAPRFAANVGASIADGIGMGALTGIGQGEGLGGRIWDGVKGGLIGGSLGGSLPVLGRAASALLSPVINPIRARLAPESVAGSKLLQYHRRAGMEPQDVADELRSARAEGQGMFTVADALGNAGQRGVAGVGRIPHNERQGLVDFLEARQEGQGRRVANTLAEGFQTPQTAAQTRTGMEATRSAVSDVNYANARQGAGPVDLTRTLTTLDDTLAPGITRLANPTDIRPDSVEAALIGVRSRLTDGRSNLTDFESIQRVRGDLSDMIQTAQRAGQNNRVRLLTGVMRDLDRDMEAAAPGFLHANRVHAAHSRAIDAVDEGGNAAMRGRVEDTIPAFRAMSPRAQEGFRAGYVDPLIERTQGAAVGVNKARPFTSDAFQAEAAAVAPMTTGAQMQRRLGRENTMFETRNAALGGSRTADNLADAADVNQVDPAIITNLLTGHFGQAARATGNRVLSEAAGMAPSVAERVTRALMERDPTRAIANINAARRSLGQREINSALIARALMGGTLAGLPAQ